MLLLLQHYGIVCNRWSRELLKLFTEQMIQLQTENLISTDYETRLTDELDSDGKNEIC